MGLSSIFRRDPADTAQNGNSALVVNDKMDLALRFFEHVIAALDIIDEARQRKDASAAAEDDTDKKQINGGVENGLSKTTRGSAPGDYEFLRGRGRGDRQISRPDE